MLSCLSVFSSSKSFFTKIEQDIHEAITFEDIETIIKHINCNIKLLEINQIRSLKIQLQKKSERIKNDIIKKEIGLLTGKDKYNLKVAEIEEQFLDLAILDSSDQKELKKKRNNLTKEKSEHTRKLELLKKKRDYLTKERSEHTRKLELLKSQVEEIKIENEKKYNSILEKINLLDNIIISSVAKSVSKSIKKITRDNARSFSKRSAPQSSVSQSYAVGGKPVNKKPVHKKPVNKKPVNKKLVNKKLVNKKLVNKKPV